MWLDSLHLKESLPMSTKLKIVAEVADIVAPPALPHQFPELA